MSALVEILDRIENTNERITQLEKAAAMQGAPASIRVGIRSMEKLRASLEADFSRLAMESETEVCRYRLLPRQGERPTVTAIAKAWTQYQALFSSVYDAIRFGPIKRRTSKRATAQTQLGFAYTFSGSIGVALTLPSSQMEYAIARDLERTAEAIAAMSRAETTENLASFVDSLGVPPVAKFGSWVDAHVAFEAGAGIDWQMWDGAAPPLIVQAQEFTRLKTAMDKITDPTESLATVNGSLQMADMDKHTFRMRLDSGERITGTFSDAINEQQRAELPRQYRAVVRTTTKIKPATEKLDVSHFLVELIEHSS